MDDTEYILTTEIAGTAYVVSVAKVGGGTVGKAYTGDWLYEVATLRTDVVVQAGNDLRTGTPKTHRQAARIVADCVGITKIMEA